MKAAMYAIIKKDFRIIASNRRLFPALFIVPLVLTIVLPSILSLPFILYRMIRILQSYCHCFLKLPGWKAWSLRFLA